MFGLVFVIVALFFVSLPLQVRSLKKMVCEKNIEWLRVHGESINFAPLHRALKRGLILGVVFLAVILILNQTGELHSTLFVPVVIFSMLAQSALNKIGKQLYDMVPAPEFSNCIAPNSLREALSLPVIIALGVLAGLTAVLVGLDLYFVFVAKTVQLNITTLILQLVAPGIFYMFSRDEKYKNPNALKVIKKLVVPCSAFMSFLLFAEFSSELGLAMPKTVISVVCYGFAVLMILISNTMSMSKQVSSVQK